MAEQWYQLPDGSSVAIDDNATDEELRNLFEQLAGEFPSSIGQAWNIRNSPFAQEEQEKGGNIFGSLLQGIENIPRGLAGIPVMAAQAAAAYATPFADTDLEKRLRKAEDWINKGINPKYADANLAKLGLAMGQVGGFALAGAAAARFGLGAGLPALLATRGVPAVAARMLTPAVIGAGGLGAAVNTSQQARMIANYEERTGEDVSAFRELAGLTGASAMGVTEAVPLFGMAGTSGILGRAIQQNTLKQAAAKTLTKQNIYSGALRGALTEAAQEAGVEIGQSALARALYDDEAMENLAEDVFDAGIIGGEAGALTSILANLASRSLAKRSSFGRDLEIENILRRRARNMQTGAYGPEAESQPESGIITSMRARIRGVSPLQRLGPGAAPTALLTEGTIFGNFAELSPEEQQQRRQRRIDLHLEAVQSEQAAIQGSLGIALPGQDIVGRETVRLPITVEEVKESLRETGEAIIVDDEGGDYRNPRRMLVRATDNPQRVDIYDTNVGGSVENPGYVTDWSVDNLGTLIEDESKVRATIPEPELLPNSFIEPDDEFLKVAREAHEMAPVEASADLPFLVVGVPSRMDRLVNDAKMGHEASEMRLEAVREAYEPVRQLLRSRFGDKVTLYRFTDTEAEQTYKDKSTQLFTSVSMARNFAQEGRRLDAVEVNIDDIIAVPAGKIDYHEFIVEITPELLAATRIASRMGGTMEMVGRKQPLTEEEQLAEASRRAQEDIDEDIRRWEENQRFEAEVGESVGIPFVELSQWSSTSIEDLVGMASEGTISPQVLAGIVASDRISKAGNTERNALRQFIIRSATPNLSYDSGAVASAIMRNIPRVIKDDAIREVYSDPSLSQQEKRSMIMEFAADYLSLNGQIDAANLLRSRTSLAPSEVNQIVRAAQESGAQGNRILNQIYGLVGGADLLERVTELETGQMPFNFQTPSDESQVEVLRRATEEKVWDNASAFQSFIENDILAPRNIFLNKSKQLGAVGRNSDAFRNMLFAITGESRLSDMTPGQRKSVLGHLSNLPVFPEPSYMPDITQRTYDPADLMSVIVGLAEARDSGRTSFASASKIQQMLGGVAKEPTAFMTGEGSTYELLPDQTTVRQRVVNDDRKKGIALADRRKVEQPPSKKTFFVRPEDATRLSQLQVASPISYVLAEMPGLPGMVGIKVASGESAGQWVPGATHPSQLEYSDWLTQNGLESSNENTRAYMAEALVPYVNTPQVGLTALESWVDPSLPAEQLATEAAKHRTGEGYGNTVHFGTEIIEVADEDADVLRVDIATVRQMMRDMIDAGYVETNAELGSGKVSAIALKPDSRPLNQAESIDTEAAETDAERYQMEQEEIDNIKTSEEFARRTRNHYEFMRTWMDNNGLSPIALELAADSESLYAAHVNLLTDPNNADRAFAYLDRPNAKIVVDLSRVDPEGTRSSDEIVREVLSEEAWTAFWEFDYLDQAAKDTMRRYARNNVVFEKTDESANRRGLTFVDLVKERRPQLNEMDAQEKAAIISMMSIIRGEAPASKAVGKVGSIKSRIIDIAKASVNAARDSDIAPMLAIYTQFEKGMLGRRGPGLSAISDESAPVRSLYYTEYADPEHLELLRQAIADGDQQAQEQIADDILNEKVNLRRAANEPTPPSFIDKLINSLNAERAVDETHVSGVPPFSPDASDEALDEVARIQRGEAPYTMPAAIKEKFRRKDMWAPTPRHRELLNSFLEEDPVDPGKKSRLSAVERFILEGDNDKTLEDTTKRFTEIANDFRYKFRYVMLQRSLPTEIQQRIKTSATGQRDMADVAAIAAQHFRDNTRNFMANAMTHGPSVWMGEGPENGMLESTLNLTMDGRPIVGMLEMFSNLGPESEKAAIAYLTAKRYTTRNAMKQDAQKILDEDDKSNNQLLTPTDRRFFEHQVEDLNWEWSEGKPITDKDAREIIENTEMGAPHVRKFFQQYQDFNKILIRSAQGMGIISKSMAEWHLKQDFVPFYTKVDPAEKWPFGSKSRPTDTTKRHPFVFMRPVLDSKNLINIDLFGNIMDNVEGVIRDGLTNVAAVRTQRDAELLTEQGLGVFTEEVDEQGADTITIYKNGEASFHRMADPLLAHSQMLIGVPITNQLIDLMRVPGYVLRETVVRTPVFMGTNMLKDSQAAYLHFGGEGFIPILSSMDQAFDPTMLERAQRVGVASSIDFVYNPSGPSLSTPGIAGKYLGFIPGINIPTPLERRMRAYKPESILDYAAASWYGLGRIGDRAEAATRMAVYDRVLAATGNRAEAAYQALEVMNYGRRGADPLWNTIMSMVPFMNGMIQGEDVLYRSLTGQEDAPGAMLSGKDVATRRMKAFNRGMHMAAASLIYYMLIRDDEAYKMASEDRKMNNYLIPLGGGKVLYMPIGFTAGTIFKVLPETFARALMEEDYDLTDVGKEWWKQANTTLDIHVMPQAVRPLWNAMRNYDEYRRQPIVPAYMADMPGEFQRTDYTSNSAAAIGKLFGVLPGGDALGLSSPMKIEYLWRQYFGTMGLYTMLTADRLIRQVTGENVVGTRYDWGVKSLVGGHGIENMPMLGDRLDDISTGTGMVNVYYDLEDRIDTAVTLMNKMKEKGDSEGLRKFVQDNRALLRYKSQIRSLGRYLDSWRERRDRLLRSNIDEDRKREMMDRLNEQRAKRLSQITDIGAGIRSA